MFFFFFKYGAYKSKYTGKPLLSLNMVQITNKLSQCTFWKILHVQIKAKTLGVLLQKRRQWTKIWLTVYTLKTRRGRPR